MIIMRSFAVNAAQNYMNNKKIFLLKTYLQKNNMRDILNVSYVLIFVFFFSAGLFNIAVHHTLYVNASNIQLVRAGGGELFGHSYSGGGMGGGFSGGMVGFPSFIFFPFFSGGGGNAFFLILLLIFFLLPFLFKRFGPVITGQVADNYSYFRPQDFGETDLSSLLVNDPNFQKSKFIDKVQTAFFAIQKGWTEKDLSRMRGYMTDTQYQRLQMQLDDFKRRNITNILEQISIGRVQLVKYFQEGKYQTIICAIDASMIDYKIEDATKKILDGNPSQMNQFTEFWTFIRSGEAKTKDIDTLISKTCPNCGAPLDINEFGKCSYCHAYVISGEFDWVLSNISQSL